MDPLIIPIKIQPFQESREEETGGFTCHVSVLANDVTSSDRMDTPEETRWNFAKYHHVFLSMYVLLFKIIGSNRCCFEFSDDAN